MQIPEEDGAKEYYEHMDAIARRFITVGSADTVYDPVAGMQTEDTSAEESNDQNEEDVPLPAEEPTSTYEISADTDMNESAIVEVPHSTEVVTDTTYRPLRTGLRENRAQPGSYTRREYGYHLTAEEATSRLGLPAKLSIVKEVKQLLDRKSWHPVREAHLQPLDKKKIIPSKLFVKVKYRPNGDFDKIKARLVAGGHRQDKSLYKDNSSSPTVATSSVFLLATIAHNENRAIATIDVPGAYLNAKVSDTTRVLMRLNKSVSDLIVQLDDSYLQYRNEDGSIVVQLDYALYGFIESAILWYELLSRKLTRIGFVNNSYDRCVFNMTDHNGDQVTLCVHVDDIFVSAKNENSLDDTLTKMRGVLGDITINRGSKHDYLGMIFDFSHREHLQISMDNYVKELLKECQVEGIASSPASDNLFEQKAGDNPTSMEDKAYLR